MNRASLSYRSACALLVTSVVIGLPRVSLSHTNPAPTREIVRVRGTLSTPESPCPEREFSVRVLGVTVRLCASDVRRIAGAAGAAGEEQLPAVVYDLQGERGVLAQINAASPGSRLTILAEWRPGRRDLFLIDLDVCPCASTVNDSDLGSTGVNR